MFLRTRNVRLFFLFLGAFAKLRKATTSFVMSVRLSARPHVTIRLPLGGLSGNSISEYYKKTVEKIQVSLKSDKNSSHCTRKLLDISDHISLSSS
jgi:hypothetical protein